MSSSSRDPSTEHFHLHYSELDDRSFQIRGRTLFVVVIIIILFLISLLLLLYARWTWISAASIPHRPPQGLDAAMINSFPVIRSTAAGLKDSECCICLALFEDGEKMKVLPNCSHWFHSDCLDKWLTARSSCPLCRSSIRVDSPV